METLRILLWADRLAVKRWFATGFTSKLFVAFLFFCIFGGIALGLYGIGGAFFRTLASFGPYGSLTAGYIIHAAIVIILWLAVGSSIAAFAGILLSPGAEMLCLISLPVPVRKIALWVLVKTVTANIILMLFAFLPVMTAYALAFQTLTVGFIFRSIVVFVCLTVAASGTGTAIALLLLRWVSSAGIILRIGGMILFFGVMLILMRIIFPPQMGLLYEASSSRFAELFASLPLNNAALPTAWYAATITSGFSLQTVFGVLLAGAVVCISLGLQYERMLPAILASRARPFVRGLSGAWERRIRTSRFPLVIKDFISVFRVPSETGYGMFLLSVALFFFLFITVGVRGQLRQDIWRVQLTVFSFGWLLFFCISYYLRFVFPLMAREGKNAWHLFSLPVPRMEILKQKLIAAAAAAIPPVLFAVLVWRFLPFAANFRTAMTATSILVIGFLAIVQALLGAIAPNFASGDSAEKVSTSGMGILTLGLSAAVTAGAGILVQQTVTGVLGQWTALAILIPSGFLLTALLYAAALRSVRTYEW